MFYNICPLKNGMVRYCIIMVQDVLKDSLPILPASWLVALHHVFDSGKYSVQWCSSLHDLGLSPFNTNFRLIHQRDSYVPKYRSILTCLARFPCKTY